VIVLADVGVRMIDLGAGRMPIGVLTALIGGPVFIALLRREIRR
jgi:ABC-type Fe3+-siderophore transport system permease subunit